MNYEIRKVDEQNSKDVLELCVSEGQRGFIESPAECLKDAEEWPEFRPVGLYVDGRLVGFAMYGALLDSGGGRNLWMDRLLIDVRFQRQGYGRRFTELLIERMLSEYGEQPIYLSVYADNIGAIRLYENLGFVFIHEYDSDGEMIFRKSF
ncbi:GNAT family N-acetyltransferase [Sporosarcina thermotolerans]|uniref:GNAT family N-acetyltransferase n=1 Tax=Sporosarcina thermotolerans TaxID=633404 RepID=A0AAW9A652_9BACL|nr:GNAT family N-acetyltransferase [Sporosarcina thermotolerans]MDW0116956.1 GNAT family N-acetyltransferase [Sporosarcina thermotolerans]WHT47928.1 GNAT family N-acetyltransferase [Sporosarcina thermotolerans]